MHSYSSVVILVFLDCSVRPEGRGGEIFRRFFIPESACLCHPFFGPREWSFSASGSFSDHRQSPLQDCRECSASRSQCRIFPLRNHTQVASRFVTPVWRSRALPNLVA